MSEHDPSTCYVCTRHAIGVGVGRADKDPQYICKECLMAIDDLTRIRRPSAYELKAREGGMDAAGEYLQSLGKTDLAEFEEEEALMLVGAIWRGCADRMRELIRNGEAPW